jgi:hypothetical protein
MSCQTCQFEIEEVRVRERLSEGARLHLSTCEVCRVFHDERQSLKRLVGSLEAVSAPPDFDFRLRARLAAAKEDRPHHSSWRSFLASAPAIGIAAAFALLVAAVVFYNQTKRSAPTENPALATVPAPVQKPGHANASSAPQPTITAPAIVNHRDEDNGASHIASIKRGRSRANLNGKQAVRRQSPQTSVNDAAVFSNDMALLPAPQILPGGGSAPFRAGVNGVASLPVRSASQPVRVFVDERGGTKRTLTLEPVVFGSQDLTGGNRERVASSQGIW